MCSWIPQTHRPRAVEAALGGPPDIVYECVGKPGLIQRCIEYCRPRGTIIVLGLCTPPDTIMPFPLVVKEGVDLPESVVGKS